VQARVLRPLLVAKVRRWAARSNGLFRAAGSHAFAPLAAEGGDAGGCRAVHFAPVKSTARAVEKTVRVYGQVGIEGGGGGLRLDVRATGGG
jgi:hypothetical protein